MSERCESFRGLRPEKKNTATGRVLQTCGGRHSGYFAIPAISVPIWCQLGTVVVLTAHMATAPN